MHPFLSFGTLTSPSVPKPFIGSTHKISMPIIRLWLLGCLSLLLLATACGGTNPVNSDPDDHAAVVEQSRRDGTVVISLDTIFASGRAYALIKAAPVTLPGRVRGTGSIVSLLTGMPAIHVVPIALYGDHYISYRFDDGRFIDTAYLPYNEGILADATTIVKNKLLTPDSIATSFAQGFVLTHPRPAYREPSRGELVVRDKSQPIITTRNEIWQTGVRIGRYDSTAFALAGFTFAQINVYLVDSTHCATITHGLSPADTVAAVVTVVDATSRDVRRGSGDSLLQAVLWFLVRGGYL